MDYICDRCERYPCSENKTKLMYRCPVYVPKPKPVTNYDLLVSESPEQLAETLANFEAKCYKRIDPSLNCAIDLYIKEKLEWLKQEAKI